MSKYTALNKLNIENLFSSSNSKPHINGKLDINTLFKSNTNDTDFIPDPDVLLNRNRQIKLKLEDVHEDLFRKCWRTITEANDAGQTDIFYDVPENIIECSNYNPKNCVKFIKNKLSQDLCIQSTTISKSRTKMFITWIDLEKRLKEKEEKENLKNTIGINSMSAFESRN
jgi:hypothetical protein